ncbi:MAG: hypothetical protein L6R48_08970, partial [Planctomycetes bacterium]|nr:hypothetical protein [Planctomycetota bacterium]
MISIHVAFHAHLDPVWLWPWTSGLDEAIATARSACDRLDAHPDISYCQGEAWTFAMIERADPALFARIRAHIAAGRWEVVNGWWTQPDCNLPGIDGLHAQLATGLDYVRERFGLRPRCGFNPDSFGHCAALPDVLRAHGQDRYVMMRPGEGEMALPARLFRWRGAGGGTVTTWRVAGSYQGGQDGTLALAQRALTDLPAGCRHALALFGIGNHGGGPTERIIALLRAGRDSIPGARLEFSTIGRFFDAVEADAPALPEVAGELQQHAIGCYSVVRAVKTGVRRAEHALARAAQADPAADLAGSWRAVCAHHFHDTLGGSSLPEAYATILDQLGGAAAAGDEALAYAVRRQVAALPGDTMPRVVFANPGNEAWSGWAEGLTYLEGPWVKQPWRLVTSQGAEVPFQVLNAGLGIGEWNWGLRRLLVRASLEPGELLPLRCDLSAPPTPIPAGVEASAGRIAAGATALATGAAGPVLLTADGRALPIALHLLDDPSDTWSHGRDRYAELPLATASWSPARVLESGPLRAAIAQEGVIGGSTL